MTWEDRLIEPAITTPDGNRYVFEYTDVEKEAEKKTSVYLFGDTDGALVQDFGPGQNSYPLTIFFSGPEYDLIANAFDLSAGESGVSVLEHPVYGIKNINILSIKRQDSVTSAGGQAIFTLTMVETIVEEVPASSEEEKAGILGGIDDLNAASAAALNDGFDTGFVGDAIAAAGRIGAFVKDLKKNFNEILQTVQEVQNTFNEINDYINQNIDFLLGSPLLLAAALQRLINTPARIASSISSRISAYLESYNALFSSTQGSGTTNVKNERLEKELLLTSIISSIAEANLFADSDGVGFLTKADALKNAQELTELLTNNQEFLDQEEKASLEDNLEKRFVVDADTTQLIKNVVASTAKNLINLSFSLKQERIIVLDRDRDLITLCFELYNTTSNEQIDFFIETNTLTGDELLKIPKGRQIKYYV